MTLLSYGSCEEEVHYTYQRDGRTDMPLPNGVIMKDTMKVQNSGHTDFCPAHSCRKYDHFDNIYTTKHMATRTVESERCNCLHASINTHVMRQKQTNYLIQAQIVKDITNKSLRRRQEIDSD